ncbi:MAG: ATP-dependent DNA helicase RecG [Ruminococcus sp.]|nr:ATP-dependent DNA helicase RecG [Ruminococcus sp.]
MPSQFHKDITYLKGVGPKRAECYNKLGIMTVYDLLNHFPRAYIDFSNPLSISQAANTGNNEVIKGKVVKKLPVARIKKGLTIYKAVFTDDVSDLTIVIYNSEYAFEQIETYKEYILYGKITGNLVRFEITNPLILPVDTPDKIQPVYALTEGLNQNMLRKTMHTALEAFDGEIYEPMPKSIMQKYSLCSYNYALENIHFPKDIHSCELAKRRLVFDELLTLQLGMYMLKSRSKSRTGCMMNNCPIDEFYKSLPFELTNGQQEAINDCIKDMCKSSPMNRLVQGDVGSGKTAVAAGAAFFAYKNGFQTALMAPTEILATQHYNTLSEFLTPLNVKVALLTGSLTPKQKSTLKQQIANGEYQVVVGTHALFQQSTAFLKLGLVITDEQHRFGVEQRAALALKGQNPHKLIMSATPIPRTLALMIYGDLDISVLKELPKGRQPVETYAVTGKLRERAFGFVKERLDEGRQAYIVCPMIDESEMDLQDAKSYAKKLQAGEFKNYRVGLLHGKLGSDEKEQIMNDFKEHKLDLLVATTVVEVGVDVPNAAVMMIENADRFGLSQLHQLRGRVGRGEHKSYCILITDNVSEESRKRLKILSKEHDGFKISEEDLKMRGPGDFFGSRQHGLPAMKIADMSSDFEILKLVQQAAEDITANDPMLNNPENRGLKQLALLLFKNKNLD